MNTQDEHFRELMKHYRPQRAPIDFSKRVMDEIHQQVPVVEYKPVFGKWFFKSFVFLFGSLLVYALFNGNGEAGSRWRLTDLWNDIPQAEWNVLTQLKQDLSGYVDQIPPILILALLAVTILLFLDQIIQYQRNRAKA
ncbi:hypothetical protein [Mangrovibacterium sp.]|uniref:hypothetical protein n=1 Tax=Mangrovibacterium sp. TaxID=1961364 RepID=UPI00356A6E26